MSESGIAFFYGALVAGMTLGFGTLAAGLYFELARDRRRKDVHKVERAERRESEAA